MGIRTSGSLASSTLTRLLVLVAMVIPASVSFADTSNSAEIDAQVWGVIAETVVAADIERMAATYHPDAILVSSKGTVAIAEQLVKWGQGMEKAQLAGTTATVSFRFESRQDDEETAFERGIFRYAETDKEGLETPAFVPFEALLVKQDGSWLMMMERQLEATDESAWDALGQ